MTEYIKSETLINHLDACMDTIWKPEIVALKCFVEGIPAADVAPVRHGRWALNKKYGDYECSECGQGDVKAMDFTNLKMRYCPNCGAKMDGGDSDA
nr:MAG TPA: DNA-directed RNA polymerase subunit [Caudoviricetes sp.]